MNTKLKYAFIIHICKYLGIALVSGSIVHAGTLGGSIDKYLTLIVIGILLTVYGNYLEHKVQHLKINSNFIALAILLSFGTGMISGGIQHYTDNTVYGSILLSLGLMITFTALAYQDFATVVSKKSLSVVAIISIILYFILSTIGASLVSKLPSDSHHEVETANNK